MDIGLEPGVVGFEPAPVITVISRNASSYTSCCIGDGLDTSVIGSTPLPTITGDISDAGELDSEHVSFLPKTVSAAFGSTIGSRDGLVTCWGGDWLRLLQLGGDDISTSLPESALVRGGKMKCSLSLSRVDRGLCVGTLSLSSALGRLNCTDGEYWRCESLSFISFNEPDFTVASPCASCLNAREIKPRGRNLMPLSLPFPFFELGGGVVPLSDVPLSLVRMYGFSVSDDDCPVFRLFDLP